MPQLLRSLVLAASLVCLGLAAPARADMVQVFAHLFVVPAALADGSDAAPVLPAFEAWLAESFGGYTRMGSGVGGWKNEAGQVETEANAVYLATANRDSSKEIAARLVQDFGVRVPYVLVLPAGAFAPRSH